MSEHTHDTSARVLLRHLIYLLAQDDTDTVPPQVTGLRFAVSVLAHAALTDAQDPEDPPTIADAHRTLRVLDGLPTDEQWRAQRAKQLEKDQADDEEARAAWLAAIRAHDAAQRGDQPPPVPRRGL